jgi:hypothetical protein
MTIIGTTIAGNRADSAGGGMLVGHGAVTLTNIRITDNHAGSEGGGGIFRIVGPIVSTNTTVANNTPDNCEPNNLIPGCT